MGKYVQNTLVNDELVVYETRLHWVTFVSLRARFIYTDIHAIRADEARWPDG